MSSYVEEKVLVKNIEHCRVKEGVRVICDNAFSECKKLKYIGLPTSLNFIGEDAFRGCFNLNKIDLPDSLVYIGDGAFYCESYREKRNKPFRITIPSSVELIDGNPFCYNSILISHNDRFKVIDNVLYSVDGRILFSYCSSKEEFEIPNGVERIGVGAFRNSPIRKIILPESLKIIDREAFKSAEKLEDVIFPNSLIEIREHAFKWCDFKNGCVTFPSKIENISSEAFDFGWHIKVIKVPKGYLNYYKSLLPKEVSNQISEEELIFENGMYFNSNKTELVAVISNINKIVIPEGTLIVRDGAFSSIFCINSIRFPSSLKYVTKDAFDYEMLDLQSIFVPKGTRDYYEKKFKEFKDEIKEYE